MLLIGARDDAVVLVSRTDEMARAQKAQGKSGHTFGLTAWW